MGFLKFVAELEVVTEDAKLTGKQRIIDLGVAYVELAIDHSAHYRLMFDPTFYQNGKFPTVHALSKRSFRILKQACALCLPASAEDLESTHMAKLAWAAVHGMSRLFIDGQWQHIKVLPTAALT